MTKTAPALAEFVDQLRSLPRDRERYHEALAGIRFGLADLETYVHYDAKCYTRNLIARTDDFELLLLCWEPGQNTPIHDHAGSEAWVYGLDDRVEEVRYRCVIPTHGMPAFERIGSARLSPRALAHVNDDIAWHTVANPTSERACSLHFYSKPIDSCRYFDPGTRTIAQRTLSYTSVDGLIRPPL